uniref:hypothetical protein n=1 Tax=Parerythrobacter lutipelagi TaxID=1964208 RepID=UPI0010F7050F|nr:hypothetical protein [Parerythrobacter lutipelagi]
MKRLAALAGAVALFAASPVGATPPTVMQVEDEPFGLSETEFFALRTTTDNLGSHFDARHETFLVATNLETREQMLWHVDSVHITTQFGETADGDRKIIKRDDGIAFANAFDVLRERGGVPWRAASGGTHWAGPPMVLESMGAVSLIYKGGERFVLPKVDAIAYTAFSSSLLAASIPDYPRLESISTREQFALRRFVSAACSYAADDFARRPQGFAPVQLVRTECADEEDFDGNSLLIPVGAVEPDEN